MAQTLNLNIDKFLGLRSDDNGDTNLKVGELAQMQNFKIVEGYNAVKRSGYSSMLQEKFDSKIDGLWYGKINDSYYTVVASGGKVYVIQDDGTKLEIGSITQGDTNFFFFDDALYIQNGAEYKKFTATKQEIPLNTLFDSSSYSGDYPATITASTTGVYTVLLKGGKGEDKYYFDGTAYGGKGGTLKFKTQLNSGDTLEISKVDGSGKGVKINKNNTTIAVVGGGGSSGGGITYYDSKGYQFKGGDGGTSIAEDGISLFTGITEGKGANGSIGGYAFNGYNSGLDGSGKSEPDGSGGIGISRTGKYSYQQSGTVGGGGYAGGGGGYADWVMYSSWGGEASSGGGSSYLIDTITAIENSRGTNNDVESALIYTTQEVFYDITTVDGYIPCVAVSSLPSGSNATTLEGINALTGKKRMQFNGDNTSATYQLLETSVTSIDKVYVGGVLKTLTTHYTVSTANGTVTFTSGNIPPTGVNNVEIYWTNGSGDRESVTKYTNAKLYGGKNDNRVFLYGVGNRIIYSDLADGVPSAEYFPVLNTIDVGSTQFEVTDLSVQYDRMLIHKEKGTWWTQYDYDSTLGMVTFPIYPLNDTIGATIKGQSQIILNNPYLVYGNMIYQFVASNVRDERNAKQMSERVQVLLNQIDMSSALTFDNESDGEYWIIIGKRVYIYNYKFDVWYYYYFNHTVTKIIKGTSILLGTDDGYVMRFDGSTTDNGELINAFMETGWIDYRVPNRTKFINFMWVQIYPFVETSCDIYVQTDNKKLSKVKTIGYSNMNFSDVDFSDFHLSTNYNPSGFRIKARAKNFTYVKFMIESTDDKSLILLGITAPAIVGGLSK